ncbi:putative UDP-N-acetylglucosamine pyrophosphorylase [Aphelenchoides besseyi]|nr:putative UDP-N-acetylglucosamine pyrophosphorylase [Aphelenchoides besseyi]KAI6212181.1 putative UDP-N-acetylglucosamine pyrophosphorylase [Aphelenchoides besseyi]
MVLPTFELNGVHYPIYNPPSHAEYTEIPGDRYFVRKDANCDEVIEYRNRGLRAIADGRLCVLVLCGGQASRLGALKPKGTLSLQLGGRFDTLLRLQAAQIIRLLNLAKSAYPESEPHIIWAVMVSESTETAVREHLKEICREFKFPEDDVILFKQNESPCFDFHGKVLYKSKDQIQTAPNGNGGLYDAIRVPLDKLDKQNVLTVLEKRGVQYFHVYCVDNILCRVGDPVFVGYSIMKGADCAAKVVEKVDPNEKVGVICLSDDRPTVVEYSEIPKEMAEQRTVNGKLAFRAGNIANHFFTMHFMKNTINHPLDYHIAKKKIKYFDGVNGLLKTPDEPNGYKLERFIFDVFPLARNFFVFQVESTEEFSPLKNDDSANVDCPRTCREALANLHAKWLKDAEVNIVQKLYVSPFLSYDGEDLHNIRAAVGSAKNGWVDVQ